MNKRLLCMCVLAAPLSSCQDHGHPFLTFDQLCTNRAEDICVARTSSCCDGDAGACDENACVQDERDQCDEARARFSHESDLSYDSEHAAQVAADQRMALDQGKGPFPLGRFFEGTLAEGKPCERDAQCESDLCDADSQACASAADVDLCPAE